MNLLSRPFRPVHLALAGAFCALTAIAALGLKAYLMSNFVPEITYDAFGVATMAGPYSYDNQFIDGIFVVGVVVSIALLVTAGVWSRMRPMV